MIKVGDFVTWGKKGRPEVLAMTGCKVLELGEDESGRPAARLDLGRFGEAGALVEDLTLERASEARPL